MQYTYTSETIANGRVIDYKIIQETAYHIDTPDRVVMLLERSRQERIRLRLYYGDKETGRDWCEVYDTVGYVGRSTGRIKIPLLIKTSRSSGGGAILDNCIVKIEYANKAKQGRRVLYQHPNYHLPKHGDTMCPKWHEPVLTDEDGNCSLCGQPLD